jgi:hypothetical protein
VIHPDPHAAEVVAPKLALVSRPEGMGTAVEPREHPSFGETELSEVPNSVDNEASSPVGSSEDAAARELTAAIDRLSLSQALLDVEIANARVLDLTARLVEANQRADGLRAEVDKVTGESLQVRAQADADIASVRAEMAAHQAYLDEQRSSAAYRWAARIWNVRNALRG